MARPKTYYKPNTVHDWEFPVLRNRHTPPVRKDGRCWVCKGERKLEAGVAAADPFCSNLCARDFFGVPLPLTESGKPVNPNHHSNTRA